MDVLTILGEALKWLLAIAAILLLIGLHALAKERRATEDAKLSPEQVERKRALEDMVDRLPPRL
jgi:hypothetical protein